MTCDECFEALSASVDGELPAHDHEAMNEHLDDCSDCQRLRARLLSVTAEMKGQPFPEPGPEAVKALTEAALAGQPLARWAFVRQLLRAPYERWPWRLGLRAASLGGMTLLVALSAIVRWLLPPYGGAEAVAKSGLPDSAAWLAWAPSAWIFPWLSLLVWLLGAWTCGLPPLLADLWSEVKMGHRQVAHALLGMIVLGPFLALPLLAELALGSYLLACCLWTGLCLVAGFLLVAFKTPRPLPRLALDFVTLILPFGLLEWLARASTGLPDAAGLEPVIALLVGSVPFSTLVAGVVVLSAAALLLGCGLAGMALPYRGAGGRPLSALLLLAGAGCLLYGWSEVRPAGGLVSPLRAELRGERKVYLLASGEDNPWLLPALEYPPLEVDVAGPGRDPRAARLRVASAYLDWDERTLLESLSSWADNAPGVTWGLSDFVDSLGNRRGSVLALPTEARRRMVGHLLVQLRWRVLAESALSQDTGSVSGRIVGPDGRREGLRLRLLQVKAGLPEVLQGLEEEVRWGGQLAVSDELGPEFSAPMQRTVVSGPNGEFEFERVPKGRYVLALLPDRPASLTTNASLPGVFEVDAARVRLPEIVLSAGSEGHDIALEPRAWQVQGQVEFTVSARGPSCQLQAGSSAYAFLDNEVFHAGTARVKVLVQGQPAAGAALQAKILARDGRLIAESSELLEAASGVYELEIASKGREGYLQVMLVSGQGPLQVQGVKVEVLP